MIKEKNDIKENKISEKPCPAYLQENYPYQATNEAITDISEIEESGFLYEIKCLSNGCELSARSQGASIKELYSKMSSDGCPVCKGKEFEIKIVKRM